jgi:hypothetical protein
MKKPFSIYKAGAFGALAFMLGCQGPQYVTNAQGQQVYCQNGTQPVQSAAGLICLDINGGVVAQPPVVIVQQHDSALEDFYLYSLMTGTNHSSDTTIVHNHYYNAPAPSTDYHQSPSTKPAPATGFGSFKQQSPAFNSFAGKSSSGSSGFGSFGSGSKPYNPSTSNYGSSSGSSSFKSFGSSSSRGSFGSFGGKH